MSAHHRFLVAAVALLVALSLVSASGAFSAMTADRPTEVAVVDDGDAYLSIEQTVDQSSVADNSSGVGNSTSETTAPPDDVANDSAPANNATSAPAHGGPTLELTLTNRFSPGVTLDNVEVRVGKQHEEISLAAGESRTLTFESVECGADITITASGSDVSTSLDRTVECD
ncbi:hypothetical protein [Natranaeroarchaeum sulfidigenes]|uniref:DUF1102 family n=1 Tax=Natranaeroarchaeum sulfidigenes TaxID=2784880 RepID=A0A897MXR7_9EURY|nr:hypothetical protein [Natranaeroarchaeum sulfidigenes]QSG03873.1 DUF1102 family [Natranaeroarchaeum sulfidigenes]